MADTSINVTISEVQPISVTMQEQQAITVQFDTVIVNWVDVVGKPTYVSEYRAYVFS